MFEYTVKADFGRGDVQEWTRTIPADDSAEVRHYISLVARDCGFKVLGFHIVRVK
jgi:hypothetical protein